MAAEPALLEPSPVPVGGAVARSVFSEPGFRFLLGSSTVAALGGSISSVAVSWLVYQETGSPLAVAYVGLVGIVPGIVLGLFAGVLADRYNRRRIMVTADVVRAIAMTALSVTLLLTGFSLLLVLGVMTVVYSFSALFQPASQAILPRMVSTDHLEDANGILAASTQTASTIGAGVGGVLIVAAGPVLGLGINAATYALSALFLFQIAVAFGRPAVRDASEHRTMGSDLAEGMRYMREHPGVLEVTLGSLPANFLLTLVLGFFVVYAATIFGHSAVPFGIIEAAFAGASAVGALMVGRIRGRRFAGVLIGLSLLVQAGGVALLVFSRDLVGAGIGAGLLGFGLGLINTAYYSTMQAIVPNELLARVLSIDFVGSFVSIPAGLVVGGILAERYGILSTYAIAAVGLAIVGAVLLALPDVRSLRYTGGGPPAATPPPPPPVAPPSTVQ